MNVRFLLYATLAIILLGGCQQNPRMQVYIDNMNAEKRVLEDSLYELQFDYEDALEELKRTQKELEELKQKDGGSKGTGRQEGDVGSPDSYLEPGGFQPPAVDQGTESGIGVPPGDDTFDRSPPHIQSGEETDEFSAAPMPLDRKITQLRLVPVLPRATPNRESEDSDGIAVVVEPQNQGNDYVPLPGRVTCVLVDPTTRQRIGSWDFEATETASILQNSRGRPGIRLQLPWGNQPPQTTRAHLFVRYWTPEGSVVEADRELAIQPGESRTVRWTPRALQRPIVDEPRVAENVSNPLQEVPSTDVGTATNEGPDDEASMPDASAKQTRRPVWRPFR